MTGTCSYKPEHIQYIFELKYKGHSNQVISDLCMSKFPHLKQWKVSKVAYVLGKYKGDERYDKAVATGNNPWDPISLRDYTPDPTPKKPQKMHRVEPKPIVNPRRHRRKESPEIRLPPNRNRKTVPQVYTPYPQHRVLDPPTPEPITPPPNRDYQSPSVYYSARKHVSPREAVNRYAADMRQLSGGGMRATFTRPQPMSLLNSPIEDEDALLRHAQSYEWTSEKDGNFNKVEELSVPQPMAIPSPTNVARSEYNNNFVNNNSVNNNAYNNHTSNHTSNHNNMAASGEQLGHYDDWEEEDAADNEIKSDVSRGFSDHLGGLGSQNQQDPLINDNDERVTKVYRTNQRLALENVGLSSPTDRDQQQWRGAHQLASSPTAADLSSPDNNLNYAAPFSWQDSPDYAAPSAEIGGLLTQRDFANNAFDNENPNATSPNLPVPPIFDTPDLSSSPPEPPRRTVKEIFASYDNLVNNADNPQVIDPHNPDAPPIPNLEDYSFPLDKHCKRWHLAITADERRAILEQRREAEKQSPAGKGAATVAEAAKTNDSSLKRKRDDGRVDHEMDNFRDTYDDLVDYEAYARECELRKTRADAAGVEDLDAGMNKRRKKFEWLHNDGDDPALTHEKQQHRDFEMLFNGDPSGIHEAFEEIRNGQDMMAFYDPPAGRDHDWFRDPPIQLGGKARDGGKTNVDNQTMGVDRSSGDRTY